MNLNFSTPHFNWAIFSTLNKKIANLSFENAKYMTVK